MGIVRIKTLKCENCLTSKNEKEFYLIGNGERFHICKTCLSKYNYDNKQSFLKLLVEMDRPFIRSSYESNRTIGEYMRAICLPQYIDLKFENSDFNKSKLSDIKIDTNKIKMSSENIVRILDKEIELLIGKIHKAREEENWGTYKNLINALKDVMLIKNEEDKKDSTYAMADVLKSCVNFNDVLSMVAKQWKKIDEDSKDGIKIPKEIK